MANDIPEHITVKLYLRGNGTREMAESSLELKANEVPLFMSGSEEIMLRGASYRKTRFGKNNSCERAYIDEKNGVPYLQLFYERVYEHW